MFINKESYFLINFTQYLPDGGSLCGGHYVAYVKHGEQWYYASDSHYNKISLESALSAEAYVLYYQRMW